MKREYSTKYYLPGFLSHIAFPIAIPIIYGLAVFIPFIEYISDPDGFSLHDSAMEVVIITVVFLPVWLTAFISARYKSSYFVVSDGNLVLKKGNTTVKELDLDSFSCFLIETTASLEASGGLIKIALFAVDQNDAKQNLYQNDIGNNLVRSWKRFMIKLKEATKKEFQFYHYVVDIDGKIYKAEDYEKIQWKKRVPLFKSPYK